MPLGTGNDLSNALGFGASIELENNSFYIENMVKKYATAERTLIDIWEVKLNLDENDGMIISHGSDKKALVDKEGNKILSFRKSFINYFSLGYDARVGFGFEKSRSSSRCCNKLIYFWEGLKKNCCTKTIPIRGFLKSFQEIKLMKESNSIDLTAKEDKCIKQDVFEMEFKNKKTQENTEEYIDVLLKGNPVSLVCQNINFYMGGTEDIWKKSGEKLGIEIKERGNSQVKVRYYSNRDLIY